jgi:2-dehydro-3-deoxyphosphogluconate aldolase/(4S)-4-hydroxy-2-oxoglutarate aldolase
MSLTPPDSDAFFAGAYPDGALPVVVILRGFSPEETVRLGRQALDAGVPLVEVPVQGRPGLDALEALAALPRGAGQHVGSGTVVSPELVLQSRERGAEFTIAPGFDDEVAAASLSAGLPHLPGVATPTEVQRVQRMGLGWVKAFPAVTLGTRWFGDIRGPFPAIRIVATGGIDDANAVEFLDAGVDVVALGSAFARRGAAALAAIREREPGR